MVTFSPLESVYFSAMMSLCTCVLHLSAFILVVFLQDEYKNTKMLDIDLNHSQKNILQVIG